MKMSELTETRLRIRAQVSERDPMTMRFVLDHDVQPGQSVDSAASDGDLPPLPAALLAIAGLERVHVSGATIRLRRAPEADWADLKPRIAPVIREVLATCDRPLGDAQEPQDAISDDSRLRDRVQDLLDSQANPAIASHGGKVSVDRVEDARVFLRFAGGCQGCAASSRTLRDGIETMLRAALPDIAEIIDVTDHDAGASPYYRASDGASPKLARPLPGSVVDQSDGALRIDPAFLAQRLGLTPDVVTAGMANGDIERQVTTRATEAGTVTQVAIFTPTRAFAADLHQDGQVFEVPPPRRPARTTAAAQALADRLRAHLDRLGPEPGTITYGALTRALGMYMPGSVRKVTEALETTMRQDAAAGRKFVAARVVNRQSGLPGKGFFDLAQSLGTPLVATSEALADYRRAHPQRP